jgi:hypothetical protein
LQRSSAATATRSARCSASTASRPSFVVVFSIVFGGDGGDVAVATIDADG